MLTQAQACQKAAAYCAEQEKCIFDIKIKLVQWNIDKALHAKIIDTLVEENFINEQRYAESFARGKLKNNHWGKIKIAAELKTKHIPQQYIQHALDSIDKQVYENILKMLLQKKLKMGAGKSVEVKNKAAQYAISKGFESALVFSVLKIEIE